MRDSVILQTANPGARNLRAIFEWQDDRYGHRIELADGSQTKWILESQEGPSADGWPMSPPFQQLHREDRDHGQQVVLLVGMSGKEHWSASIEIDGAGESIMFDIACRIGTPDVRLGSTYRRNADASLRWQIGPVECEKHFAEMDRQGELVSFIPQPPFARTVRWKYRVTA